MSRCDRYLWKRKTTKTQLFSMRATSWRPTFSIKTRKSFRAGKYTVVLLYIYHPCNAALTSHHDLNNIRLILPWSVEVSTRQKDYQSSETGLRHFSAFLKVICFVQRDYYQIRICDALIDILCLSAIDVLFLTRKERNPRCFYQYSTPYYNIAMW